MKIQSLSGTWNFMRLLRLTMGLIVAYQALETHESALGILSFILLFQALTNTGCCITTVSNEPVNKNQDSRFEEVVFEEIKTK